VTAGTVAGISPWELLPAMDIPATVIDLLRQRAQGVSICPSDVARALTDLRHGI